MIQRFGGHGMGSCDPPTDGCSLSLSLSHPSTVTFSGQRRSIRMELFRRYPIPLIRAVPRDRIVNARGGVVTDKLPSCELRTRSQKQKGTLECSEHFAEEPPNPKDRTPDPHDSGHRYVFCIDSRGNLGLHPAAAAVTSTVSIDLFAPSGHGSLHFFLGRLQHQTAGDPKSDLHRLRTCIVLTLTSGHKWHSKPTHGGFLGTTTHFYRLKSNPN